MELLEQLESRIASLLDRLDRLKEENERAHAASLLAAGEKALLEDENRKLRASLEKEERLRVEALKRIDALLRKIQEHDSIE